MNIKKVLSLIERLAEINGLSRPFIVGGIPRDKLLMRFSDFKDIDISNGDSGIHFLSHEVMKKLEPLGATAHYFSDGHSRIFFNNIAFDFSSNFIVPGIDSVLNKMGIYDITPMTREIYSRDFTINSVLLDMNLSEYKDLTNRGFKDLKNKIIDTNLSPEITFLNSKNRAIRAIYYYVKLDFIFSDRVFDYLKNNPNIIKSTDEKYLASKISKISNINKEKTKRILYDLDLVPYLPTSVLKYIV